MQTPTLTEQGNSLTCSLHVCSKLMLKIVEYFHPLPLDETYDCNRFLDTTFIRFDRLTPERCTLNGYLKILLFYYFYYLYEDSAILLDYDPRYPKLSLEDVLTILPEVKISKMSDRIFLSQPQMHDTERMIQEFNEHMKGYTLEYTTVHNIPGLLPILEKVIRKGFYVGAVLVDRETISRHSRHAVHIVDVTGHKVDIKDSLITKKYSMNVDESIHFEENGHTYTYEIETCLFLLPCKTKPLTEVRTPEQLEVFNAWLDTGIAEKGLEVGDSVDIKGVGRGKIVSKVGNYFEVFYMDEKGIEKEREFLSSELTKVGGTRRRRKSRKSRKRIR